MTRLWFRYQLGLALLPLLNVSLLSISAAPVIARFLDCRALWVALVLPPVAAGLVCLAGWVMDKAGYTSRMESVYSSRSPLWKELFERLDRMERENKSK